MDGDPPQAEAVIRKTRQASVTGNPVRTLPDGKRQILEYELDGHWFDDFDFRRSLLRDVKDDYDFAFNPDKMRKWRDGEVFDAWTHQQQRIARDALTIARRHGFTYEYLVDPRHLEDWQDARREAIREGLIVNAW